MSLKRLKLSKSYSGGKVFAFYLDSRLCFCSPAEVALIRKVCHDSLLFYVIFSCCHAKTATEDHLNKLKLAILSFKI